MLKCTSINCCAIKKIRDYYSCGLFGKCTCDVVLSTNNVKVYFKQLLCYSKIRDDYFCGLFGKCTCDVILSTKVFNITALFASSVLSTYATLLGFHSREGCCRGGRKDGC